MKRAKRNILLLFCAFLPSCVSQFEHMARGGPQGDSYTYHYGQVGGQGTAQSSMGTSVAFDGQKSFADLLQAWSANKISLNTLRGRISDNGVAMHREGQITARQLAKFKSDVELAQGREGLELALAQLTKR